MEDDPKILNVEYLSLLDHPQVLNLSLGDQTKRESYCERRQPPMEDDF